MDNNQDFNVNMICYESFPCKHYCWYGNGDNMITSKLMSGTDIEKILREQYGKTGKIDIKVYSHFADYKNVKNIFDSEDEYNWW